MKISELLARKGKDKKKTGKEIVMAMKDKGKDSNPIADDTIAYQAASHSGGSGGNQNLVAP